MNYKTMSEPVTNEIVETFTKIKRLVEEESPKDKQTRDDNSISTLQGYPGFESLKTYIETVIERLNTMQGMVEPKDSVESIGFRFLACQTAAHYLKMIIDLPYGLSEVQKRQAREED